MEDGRCKLGLAGRRELVVVIEQGRSFRQAAAGLGVGRVRVRGRYRRRWSSAFWTHAGARITGAFGRTRRAAPFDGVTAAGPSGRSRSVLGLSRLTLGELPARPRPEPVVPGLDQEPARVREPDS